MNLREQQLTQPTISRAELQAGEERANEFQRRMEERACDEWGALADIALEWLTDTQESFEFVQIIWLLENPETRADGRKRIEAMRLDFVSWRVNNPSIGERIEIERGIGEDE